MKTWMKSYEWNALKALLIPSATYTSLISCSWEIYEPIFLLHYTKILIYLYLHEKLYEHK